MASLMNKNSFIQIKSIRHFKFATRNLLEMNQFTFILCSTNLIFDQHIEEDDINYTNDCHSDQKIMANCQFRRGKCSLLVLGIESVPAWWNDRRNLVKVEVDYCKSTKIEIKQG